jgi:hypothetical protein
MISLNVLKQIFKNENSVFESVSIKRDNNQNNI